MAASSDAASDGKGAVFMVVSEFLLCIVNAIVKFVKAWPAERIMLIRYSLDLVLCVALCCALRMTPPHPKTAAKLILRGIAYIAFIVCLWAGLRSCLPLGDVVVVVVATSPLFLVILTRVFLGEKIPSGWILQMVLCVTGALLVNKPLAPPPGCTAATTLIPIAAAFFGALMNFASRNVKDVPPPVVTAFNDLVAVIFSFGYLVLQRSSDDIEATILPDGFDKNFGIVIVSAVIGWFGLMSNVKGYQSVSVAAVASIAGYVSVPFGYITQILVFNEMPDVFSIVGALLILGTNISVAISKYHAMKAAKESECSKPLIGVDAQEKEEAKMGA